MTAVSVFVALVSLACTRTYGAAIDDQPLALGATGGERAPIVLRNTIVVSPSCRVLKAVLKVLSGRSKRLASCRFQRCVDAVGAN